MKTFKKKTARMTWFLMGGALLIGVASLVVVSIMTAQESARTSKENQGYVRYVACMIDIRNTRGAVTVDDVTSNTCWDIAEHEVVVELRRFSDEDIDVKKIR